MQKQCVEGNREGMGTEKFFFIAPQKARELLRQVRGKQADKRGLDSRVRLTDEYAVLAVTKLKWRNYPTRDDDLAYYDELVQCLMRLRERGVAVVPILGYCYDPDSEDGKGYVIQQRAKGEELYDDARLKEFYVGKERFSYLSGHTDAKQYLLERTAYVSRVPQEHFDKWIQDVITLLDNDVLVDFHTKSNFFHDAEEGFSFIDLNSHTDYKYGLADQKPNGREIAAYYGFLPCHFAPGTKVLPDLALDSAALSEVEERERLQLASANRVIFEKCKSALSHNGVSQELLDRALAMVKVFGT